MALQLIRTVDTDDDASVGIGIVIDTDRMIFRVNYFAWLNKICRLFQENQAFAVSAIPKGHTKTVGVGPYL